MKILFVLLIILLIAGALFYAVNRGKTGDYTSDGATTMPSMTIEEYVRKNISTLSPEKEQVGGTFYVTNIEAAGGVGTVKYEDGHVAYVADFTYVTDQNGTVSVTSFTVRK
jgi:hypothetical protein